MKYTSNANERLVERLIEKLGREKGPFLSICSVDAQQNLLSEHDRQCSVVLVVTGVQVIAILHAAE